MKSLSSTVRPWPASTFSMSSISMPRSFMRPFTGRPRLLMDFAWTRILPSGVASTVPLTLKGMSIFLSSLPFCFRSPSSTLRTRSLTGGSWPHEDVLVHERVERRLVDRDLPGLHRDHVRAAVVEVRDAPVRVGTKRPRRLRTRRVTSAVMWRSTFRMSTLMPCGAAARGRVRARARGASNATIGRRTAATSPTRATRMPMPLARIVPVQPSPESSREPTAPYRPRKRIRIPKARRVPSRRRPRVPPRRRGNRSCSSRRARVGGRYNRAGGAAMAVGLTRWTYALALAPSGWPRAPAGAQDDAPPPSRSPAAAHPGDRGPRLVGHG